MKDSSAVFSASNPQAKLQSTACQSLATVGGVGFVWFGEFGIGAYGGAWRCLTVVGFVP